MSVEDKGLCKVILLIAVLSSATNDSRNILHWYIYIMKENHTVVPHNLIWIKTGLIKLFWVCFDVIGFWQWGTISWHGFICPLFNYSRCQPWGSSAPWCGVVALARADAEMLPWCCPRLCSAPFPREVKSISLGHGEALGSGHPWQKTEPFRECSWKEGKHEKWEFSTWGSIFLNNIK